MTASFEWDEGKNQENQYKHGVSFELAKQAFADPRRIILEDVKHSSAERRLFCLGWLGNKILTVRFTMRGQNIRIIGAGFWREGKEIYEKRNRIH